MSTAPLYSQDNPAVLAIGSAINTDFKEKWEDDWFKVELVAGTTYQFELLGAAAGLGFTLVNDPGLGAWLQLYDAQQNSIDQAFASRGAPGQLPSLPFTAPTSGTYYLRASGFAAGTYQLRASVKPDDDVGSSLASHGHLAVGTGLDAELGLPNDLDWFALDLTAGTLYKFTLVDEAGGSASEMAIGLFQHGVERLSWPERPDVDPWLNISGTPEESGRYYLQVTGNGATGKYRLSAVAMTDDYAATVAGSGRLLVGGVAKGRLEADGDRDWFEITLEAGQTYQFGATATTGEMESPYISLYNPANGRYTSASSLYSPLASGNYYLQVNGEDPGAYTLSATRMSDDFGNVAGMNPGRLIVGQTLDGRIDYAGDVDCLRMAVSAGTIYEGVLSNSSNPGASLHPWDGNETDRQYDHMGLRQEGASTVLTFRARVSGELDLTTSGPANSTYTASVRIVGMDDHGGSQYTATKLAPGDAVGGRIETAGDVDAFTMNVTAGTSYLLQAGGELAGSALKLSVGHAFSPDAPRPMPIYTAMTSGEIVVYASAGASVGSYSLTPVVTPNDWFLGGVAATTFDGGAGLDTVSYSASLRDFNVVRSSAGIAVHKTAGWSDMLLGVERVLFADGALAFDDSGVGGAAYRLYRAAFDRAPDKAGLGYWIAAMDKGASLYSVAQGFVGSNEFKLLYGAAPTNAEFVERLYLNVLDRDGEKAGVDYWVGVLESGMSKASVLAGFSESAENVAAVAELIGAGFEYQPFI